MKSVLVLDNEPEIISHLKQWLEARFRLIEAAVDLQRAEELVERCHFDLIIVATCLQDGSGVEWVSQLRQQGRTLPVIFLAAEADPYTVIEALRVQAADYLLKPLNREQVQTAVDRILQQPALQPIKLAEQQPTPQHCDVSNMVGACREVLAVCKIIKQIAPMPSTVLIEGETGTGKELAARAIHELSQRAGNFVSINCGGMSAELLESELFGHIKGAFTGADRAREGLFTHADKGTLFLDEIGEMPMPMQIHLLRVLEERKIRPVGSNVEMAVDVRILAATNRKLYEEVQAGHFREDLFYRLNVLSIRMPPLREREGDIQLLARYFAGKLAADLGVRQRSFTEQELEPLTKYHWPGNVRELKNVIERALLLDVMPAQCLTTGSEQPLQADDTEQVADELLLEAVEKQHILNVLEMQQGNKSAAARLLGISRKTMERKLKAWRMF